MDSPRFFQRRGFAGVLAQLFACVWLGRSGMAHAGEPSAPAELPPLRVEIDESAVDLEQGKLVVRLSRPAARVTLKVIALSGAVLANVEKRFDGAPAGTPLVVEWEPPDSEADPLARLEVFGYDTSDYYKGVAITPWSFSIPHEDVVFETDSAEIRAREAEKLRASLALIKKELQRSKHLGKATLFIVAHTDTVGTREYNLALSGRRAKAIARWFRGVGLGIPMAYYGAGEQHLEVVTADEVDEAKNRRADYMLSVELPRFRRSGMQPNWQKI